MEEPWDSEDVGAKAKPQANWPIISRMLRWRYYSIAFGLVMPVACFGLEFVLLPALGWLPGLVFFHRYCLFGYGVVAVELVALAIWLGLGHRLRCLSAGFAGVLLAGSLFAGVLGLVLLPFAIPGVLFLGIGLLGFVPLFTANVYFRHGMAAYRQAGHHLGNRSLFEALLWAAILVYALPGLIQARISVTTRAALREVIVGDDARSRAAVGRLRPYWWVADFDPLRRAFEREPDLTRQKRFEHDYRELTGDDIRTGPDRFIEYGGPDRLIRD
jgi:hypothetical protein